MRDHEMYAYIKHREDSKIMKSIAKYKLCGRMGFGLHSKRQIN
jgi:hypothetical protein